MTAEDETTDTAGEEKWWTLLRRAFRVPDIVAARNREDAVAHALAPDDRTSERRRVADAGKIVKAVAQLGGQGKLDQLFYETPAADHRIALTQQVIERAKTADNFETRTLIAEVFDVVTDHVTNHRFEDEG
jgi:hypothetical protein